MAILSINYRAEWLTQDTDLSTCRCCEETIYSQMRVLCITPVSGEWQGEANPTEVRVCASCFDAMVMEGAGQ